MTVRAQYGAGNIHGKDLPSYRREPGVKPDSTTETYVALKLLVENWRWAGVPFYLRTGKAMLIWAQPDRVCSLQAIPQFRL